MYYAKATTEQVKQAFYNRIANNYGRKDGQKGYGGTGTWEFIGVIDVTETTYTLVFREYGIVRTCLKYHPAATIPVTVVGWESHEQGKVDLPV